MSTWLPPTAEEEPVVTLVSWGAFEVFVPELEAPTIHVAGMKQVGATGRVSSPVVKVDVATRSVVTSTGRTYRLLGAPGLQGDASYVWSRWLWKWNAKVRSDAAPALAHSFDAEETLNGEPRS